MCCAPWISSGASGNSRVAARPFTRSRPGPSIASSRDRKRSRAAAAIGSSDENERATAPPPCADIALARRGAAEIRFSARNRRARIRPPATSRIGAAGLIACNAARNARSRPERRRDRSCVSARLVGERDLPSRLAMRLQRRQAVDRVDQRRHAGDARAPRERGVGEQRVQDRRGIGEAAGLQHDARERRELAGVAPAQDVVQAVDQIAAQFAAQAARGEQHDVVGERLVEPVVEPDLAEFVDDRPARRRAPARAADRLIRLVLPAPRNPVTTCSATASASLTARPGSACPRTPAGPMACRRASRRAARR